MKYPTVLDGKEVFGIYVHEPGSLVSNFAIASVSFFLVWKYSNVKGFYAKSWLYFILCIGLGATGGMVIHGFPTLLTPEEYFFLWGGKNSFIPLANFFASLAVLAPKFKSRTELSLLLGFKALVVSSLIFITYDFLPAVVDLAITYILVISMTARSDSVPGSRYLRRAFVLALISGFLYLFPFKLLDGWFTNKDAVHVFVVISLIIISRAIKEVHSN